jgi:dihydrofolate reductase
LASWTPCSPADPASVVDRLTTPTKNSRADDEPIERDPTMQLVVHEFLSLDGVMQGPGGIDEDRSNGFDRGGWIVPFAGDKGQGAVVDSWFARAEAFLLGRTTYEMMYSYWSQVTDPDNSVATALNNLPKHVVSSTLLDPKWNAATVLTGDLVQAVAGLKARDGGELQVHGSWRLARSLHEAGLVDEYRLLIFPVCVGAGKRLFPDNGPPTGFTVVESRSVDSGTVYLALRPAPYERGGFEVVGGKEVLTQGE